MNRQKAERKVKRKIARAKTCPFCGKVPRFSASVDEKQSSHGSIGHYAIRERCCAVTSNGQTELFFVNTSSGRSHNFRLWVDMVNRLINDWNKRA